MKKEIEIYSSAEILGEIVLNFQDFGAVEHLVEKLGKCLPEDRKSQLAYTLTNDFGVVELIPSGMAEMLNLDPEENWYIVQ